MVPQVRWDPAVAVGEGLQAAGRVAKPVDHPFGGFLPGRGPRVVSGRENGRLDARARQSPDESLDEDPGKVAPEAGVAGGEMEDAQPQAGRPYLSPSVGPGTSTCSSSVLSSLDWAIISARSPMRKIRTDVMKRRADMFVKLCLIVKV